MISQAKLCAEFGGRVQGKASTEFAPLKEAIIFMKFVHVFLLLPLAAVISQRKILQFGQYRFIVAHS